jgi:hypothetical protein
MVAAHWCPSPARAKLLCFARSERGEAGAVKPGGESPSATRLGSVATGVKDSGGKPWGFPGEGAPQRWPSPVCR